MPAKAANTLTPRHNAERTQAGRRSDVGRTQERSEQSDIQRTAQSDTEVVGRIQERSEQSANRCAANSRLLPPADHSQQTIRHCAQAAQRQPIGSPGKSALPLRSSLAVPKQGLYAAQPSQRRATA
jgi:hypothetical protein